MNSSKLSLAINCLLWLSITPRSLCDAGMLQSRQDHLNSGLGAKQQLSDSKEIDVPFRVLEKRLESTGNQTDPKNTGSSDTKDPQNSLDLSPLALQEASKHDGKEKPEQIPSLTSPNNFINFCISGAGTLGNAVIQNGAQTKKVNACNGIPMGMIPAPDKTPSLRFFSPKNLDTVPAKKTFTVSISVKNLDAGHFTAPLETYFAAPITLNEAAVVIGHTHIVAQRVESLTSTALLDPREFKFFKGIDSPVDKEGKLHAEVKDGLEKGVYRFSTMTAGANHQPIAVAIAQHDSMDDVIYITVE
ncbi:uncharacterized protein MELLADRAFT_124061 [Melampsora larici-populina 98AG31]|uniref:Secreted protein n=1 Tax=Melampsora larici-populina (strain 98AG31 / pathotype 3-4-7) TaxID=747676 RepID=F4S6X0_MELLP|nr:uncharacterized protein MELLADRAFT_124061 [Melampsora larici-populina 98AG31]EGF99651.1 hypothetical protein MELLADRAFT_124061 [Melampsora larici-populina 98AG31]